MKTKVKFPLGQIVATPGAIEALNEAGQTPMEFLERHKAGDWGDLSADDKKENDRAVIHGDRILSAYHTNEGEKIWIVTEWDRSVTTLLLPEEY